MICSGENTMPPATVAENVVSIEAGCCLKPSPSGGPPPKVIPKNLGNPVMNMTHLGEIICQAIIWVQGGLISEGIFILVSFSKKIVK